MARSNKGVMGIKGNFFRGVIDPHFRGVIVSPCNPQQYLRPWSTYFHLFFRCKFRLGLDAVGACPIRRHFWRRPVQISSEGSG